ncbi:uncharacterized protein [Rutidosis leptorrhynchoides]|uniref:uncharacterized protein n=1 Tax=Rutidosis leptorrhynchoides TaxID=125765 RepID=UPI003A992FEC
MLSDQEIAKGVEILLTQSDHKSFKTLTEFVHSLSLKLGFDLSHKSLFIRDQINLFLFRSQQPPQPQQLLPPPLTAVAVTTSGIVKDQYAPQYHFNQQQQQFYQHQQHYALQQQQLHQYQQQQQQPPRQRHPVELNFSKAVAPQHTAVVSSPLPEVKSEGGGVLVQGVGVRSSEKPKKGGAAGTKRRGGPGGLNKLCGITPELQVIVGESALSRTDIVKQLWAYIKKNNLQDPGNKRKIICDDALRVVFETDCTDMFKMNKLLAKHIIRLEPTKESSHKKSKVDVEPVVESTDNVPRQVIISEALANCLDTGEREMSQSEALRLVWEYIKVNNLEDPQNPVMILCDEKLKNLFGCESISAMKIPELLVEQHLFNK